MIELQTPIQEHIEKLRAGDSVLLSGSVITARDAAHKRLFELIKNGAPLPVNLAGETIYYVGPSAAPPGYAVGSAGPTSSCRMDPYTPALLDLGLKGMIGKGLRAKSVVDSIIKNKAVYFAAVGGAAALIAKCITRCEVVAYPELGPEAIYRFTIEKLPLIVAIDSRGTNIFEREMAKYAVE